jgi:phosphoglycolate phosphatase-like HAD superfamily hydrolase
MWDIDRTLLYGGGVAVRAWATAFTAVTGLPWEFTMAPAGRTDRDLAAEVFGHHGIADAGPYLDRFFRRYAAEVAARRHLFAEHGRLLPGVPEVLAALAARPQVVQTLVTGNIAPVASDKLAAFGLGWAFDADIGGYGTDDTVRATLVRRSRERAERRYGHRFDVVVIGDTVHDITAALANDVTAVGVATGGTDAATLRAAGAHTVFVDLSDVDTVVRVLAG